MSDFMSASDKEFDPINICRPNIKNLQAYTSARDEYVSDGSPMVFLDANENPYETELNRYPDPWQRSLKEVWALEKGIDTHQILFGNGSDEVLDLLFRAFCDPLTDHIITLPPTYGMYGVLAHINDVTNKEVPLLEDFSINTTAVLEAVTPHTKLIFICSPNNPSGNLMNVAAVKQLLNKTHGLVVIDEAYIDFTSQESYLNLLDEYPNLVVTQTLSKAYGLAGIRLGVLMASKELIAILHKVKPPYNVNVLTQTEAKNRILDQKAVQAEIKEIVTQRALLKTALEGISFVSHCYDSEANFILARVDHAAKRYAQFVERGVVVRNRSKQLHCDNCLRFTVGTAAENKILIETLHSLT